MEVTDPLDGFREPDLILSSVFSALLHPHHGDRYFRYGFDYCFFVVTDQLCHFVESYHHDSQVSGVGYGVPVLVIDFPRDVLQDLHSFFEFVVVFASPLVGVVVDLDFVGVLAFLCCFLNQFLLFPLSGRGSWLFLNS